MKLASLESADAAAVAEAARRVVIERGASVSEATRSRVVFHGLRPPRRGSYAMEGYVGTHQRAGEPGVDLRYEVRARVPSRIFRRVTWVGLLLMVALFLVNPSPSPWVAAVTVVTLALVVASVVLVATWRTSRELEDELLAATLAELRTSPGEHGPAAANRAMEAWDAGLQADLEEARAREDRRTPTSEGPAAPDAEREVLHQRLRALRAELERRRVEADAEDGPGEPKD